jgi:hypothetical protein
VVVAGRKVVGSAQLRQMAPCCSTAPCCFDDQSLVRELAGDGRQVTGEITLRMALGRQVSFTEAAAGRP